MRWSEIAASCSPRLKPAALALLLCCSACTVPNAGPQPPTAAVHTPVSLSETPYYVEFRARPSIISGHTYLVYGALGKNGEPAEEKLIGFLPRLGVLGLFVGMLGMPGELGKAFLDEKVPDLEAYRRYLTASDYEHLLAFINEQERQPKVWNMFLYNCNDFAADAAEAIGMKVPTDRFIPPAWFVYALSSLNTEPDAAPAPAPAPSGGTAPRRIAGTGP